MDMGSTWEKCLRGGILWAIVYTYNLLSLPIVPRCQVIVYCSQASGARFAHAHALVARHTV